MKKIAILGSTGSIGTQTLEIVRKEPDLQVTALAAGANGELMEKQVREFHPSLVAMWIGGGTGFKDAPWRSAGTGSLRYGRITGGGSP